MPPCRHEKDCLVTKMYYGMGDTIMLRPFVQELAKRYRHVYLDNAFPELFWDIPNVRLFRVQPGPRTHDKIAKMVDDEFWYPVPSLREFPPENQVYFNFQPALHDRLDMSLVQYVEEHQVELNGTPFNYTIPMKPEWLAKARQLLRSMNAPRGKPIVWFHLPTIRKEWCNPNRSCHPEYMQGILDRYKGDVFFFDIADLEAEWEWRNYDYKGLSYDNTDGSVPVPVLWALTTLVDGLVLPHCWPLHVVLATRARTLCLWGGFAHWKYIIDYRCDTSNLWLVSPEEPCTCLDGKHGCKMDLDVNEIFEKFEEMLWTEKPSSLRIDNPMPQESEICKMSSTEPLECSKK